MAGRACVEWIAVDCNLATKPEVLELSEITGVPVDAVVGRLVRFWSWAAMATADGVIRATPRRVATIAGGDEAFWVALSTVDWVTFDADAGTLTVVGWEKRFARSAKSRLLDARRKAAERVEKAEVRDLSGSCPKSVRFVSEIRPNETGPDKTRQHKTRHTHRGVCVSAPLPPTHPADTDGEPAPAAEPSAGSDPWRAPGWAHDAWSSFVVVWNATPRAVPWRMATPPGGWVDHAADPGWLERARVAVDRLPSCRFFDRPLAVTRFFGFVDRIIAGEFDDAKNGNGGGL